MSEFGAALVAAFVIGYALFERRLSRSSISGPLMFVSFGLAVGSEGVGWIDFDLDDATVRAALELTLGLVLFVDATRVDLREVARTYHYPSRLLGIGLPLTIAAGFGLAASLFTGLDFWDAALVGAILAPTDPALGRAVVTDPRVPGRIRQSLQVESGLNDGIALPFVLVFLARAVVDPGGGAVELIVETALQEIALGVGVGVFVGSVVAWLLREFYRRGWIDEIWMSIVAIATPVLAFLVADPLEGSGFLATFVGGLLFGALTRELPERLHALGEGTSHLLTLLVFVVFGGEILSPVLGDLDWRIALYALASLTLVRIVPVAISMIGSNLHPPTVLFMGWFGPRGLASVLFLAIVLVEGRDLPELDIIQPVVAWTVAFSVVLHGLSARWGTNRYVEWATERARRENPSPT